MSRDDRGMRAGTGYGPGALRLLPPLLVLVAALGGCGGSSPENPPDDSVVAEGALAAPERTPGTHVVLDDLALDVSWETLADGWAPVAGAATDEAGIVKVEQYDGWLHVTAHLTDDGRIRQVGLFGEDLGRLDELLADARHIAETLGGAGCWEDLERSLAPSDLSPDEVANGRCGEAVFTLAALPDAVAFIAAADPGLQPPPD